MQLVHISYCVSAWFALASPTDRPVVPGDISVTASKVEVRSRPAEDSYPTCQVKKGDRLSSLHVVLVGPGWVAIKPPPGSFSWIDASAVKRVPDGKTGVIVRDRAPVLVGSSLRKEKPDLAQGALKRGEVVEIIGPSIRAEDGEWTPIRSPAFEVRYIPISAMAEPAPTKQKGAIAQPPAPPKDEVTELRARVQELERRLAKLEAATKKD